MATGFRYGEPGLEIAVRTGDKSNGVYVMRRLAVLAIVAFTMAAPALAQDFMSAAEARRTFFGIDMEGVHQPSGARWRECIDRSGNSTYHFAGSIDAGRLTVRNDGALCWAYASRNWQNPACWRVRPQGRAGFRFESVNGDEGVFVTTATRRVAGCTAEDAPVS